MRRTVSLALGAAGLVGGAVLALPSEARADNCPTTNAVYMSGSSAFAPVLGATQIALSALGTPANIIYQKPGSCEGLKVILGESGAMPTTDAHSANYFPNGVLTPCTLSDAGPASTTVDIGISDVYTETCQGTFDSALNSVGTTIGATVALPTKDFSVRSRR